MQRDDSELNAGELRLDGEQTDPLWYLVAEHYAPRDHRRQPWIEGYVAALDTLTNGDPGVAEVLRSTVGLDQDAEVEAGEAP